jgi:hypothetical protein
MYYYNNIPKGTITPASTSTGTLIPDQYKAAVQAEAAAHAATYQITSSTRYNVWWNPETSQYEAIPTDRKLSVQGAYKEQSARSLTEEGVKKWAGLGDVFMPTPETLGALPFVTYNIYKVDKDAYVAVESDTPLPTALKGKEQVDTGWTESDIEIFSTSATGWKDLPRGKITAADDKLQAKLKEVVSIHAQNVKAAEDLTWDLLNRLLGQYAYKFVDNLCKSDSNVKKKTTTGGTATGTTTGGGAGATTTGTGTTGTTTTSTTTGTGTTGTTTTGTTSTTTSTATTPSTSLAIGSFDGVSDDCSYISGWACNPSNTDATLNVQVMSLGVGSTEWEKVGSSTPANIPREQEVADLCGGKGRRGFNITLPTNLRNGVKLKVYTLRSGANFLELPLTGEATDTINC